MLSDSSIPHMTCASISLKRMSKKHCGKDTNSTTFPSHASTWFSLLSNLASCNAILNLSRHLSTLYPLSPNVPLSKRNSSRRRRWELQGPSSVPPQRLPRSALPAINSKQARTLPLRSVYRCRTTSSFSFPRLVSSRHMFRMESGASILSLFDLDADSSSQGA
jgi:hypothetical protein